MKILVLILLISFAGMGYWQYVRKTPETVVVVSPTESSSGHALIGGSFSLTDTKGIRRTEADFRGKYMLVYFGYSFCPDICPMALEAITLALNQLPPKMAAKIQPLFITVDPQRDTVQQLATYQQLFHPQFVMLTGTREQVRTAMKAYRVYAARAPGPEENENYVMDHSSIVYFMDPQGKYVGHFNHQTPASDMVKKIQEFLQQNP